MAYNVRWPADSGLWARAVAGTPSLSLGQFIGTYYGPGESAWVLRDEMWDEWSRRGGVGPTPDQVAEQALLTHMAQLGGGYTEWSTPLGVQDRIKAAGREMGAAWVEPFAPDAGALQAQHAQYVAAHAEANKDDDDFMKFIVVGGLALTGLGLAGYGPLAGALGAAEAGAAVVGAEAAAAVPFAEVAAAEAALAAEVASAAAGSGALVAGESFAGPATGTVLEAGVQASGAIVHPISSAGFPEVIGIATGSGPFISVSTGLPLPELRPPTPNPFIEKAVSGAKSAVVSALAPAVRALLGPKAPESAPLNVAPAGGDGGGMWGLLLLAGLALVALR